MTCFTSTNGSSVLVHVIVAFGALVLAPGARAQISPPLDVDVPMPPSVVAADGQRHLVYELHITNFGAGEIDLRTLQVLDANRRTTLLDYSGQELKSNLRRVGVANAGEVDTSVLPGGMRTVAFVWVTLPGETPEPTGLAHRLIFTSVRDGDSTEMTLDTGPVHLAPTPATIGPPLAGDNWLSANGPSNESGHRRALIPVAGAARIAQRFAIDWVQVKNGSTSSGDPKINANYYAWGSEALAVADGVVASTKDGIPENVPGLTSRAVPITLETVGGNYVILDIGGGRFAFYAHLQPGTIRVAPGDRVRRGDVLGLVGNSGNSTEPHLHFHIANANSALGAEGVPYLLESFEVIGRTSGFGAPLTGQPAERHTREMPVGNMLVSFGK